MTPDVADLLKIPHPKVNQQPQPEASLERERLENDRLREAVKGLQQDTSERKRYALAFFLLSCVWILVITAILMLQGFGSFWFGRFPFKLSESVILAVIGSTTANVIGILLVVAKYLFPNRP